MAELYLESKSVKSYSTPIDPMPIGERLEPRARRARVLLLLGAISWLLVITVGLWILWDYENSPGKAAAPPQQWPADSKIQPARDHPTLLILGHPHCPCTRATVGELASIMAHTQKRLTAYVLFVKPAGFSDEWEKTDLWQSAALIPGVNVVIDDEGAEAMRFHVATSGQALLYDGAGRLLFSGGVTASRGHYGDNAGQNAIVSFVNSGIADRTETFVFGCPLFDPESECRVPKDEKHKH
jgi:hypothetical protein